MSKHHPDEVTLLDYSAGTLPMPQALAVATHLSRCEICRSQASRLDSLGGAVLEQTSAEQVVVKDFDQFMASVDDDQQIQVDTKAAPPKTKQSRGFVSPLARLLPDNLEDIQWRQQTRDIGELDLTKTLGAQGYRVALQKIRAGSRVPKHTHRGRELTVILSGGFSDELGVYHTGDFISRDTSHYHSPTALQNEDCICLTVLDAPIRFVGPLTRLLNPFMAWR